MATITAVTLRNFRGFARLEKLRLAPLTFLVGPNSAGKSSVADALLFIAQSGFLSLDAISPHWIGPLVDLGSFRDTVFRHETTRKLEVQVGLDLAEALGAVEVAVEIKATKRASDGHLHKLAVRLPEREVGAELVRRAGRGERFEARAANGVNKEYDAQEPWFGPGDALRAAMSRPGSGGLTRLLMSLLDRVATSVQRVSSGRNPPQRSYLRDGGTTADGRPRRLLNGIDAVALEAWRETNNKQLRRKLIEGLTALGIADDLAVSRISDYLTELHLQDNVTGVTSNLTEFGYGASQVLPVLEGCAVPGDGPLFIEQPEIHLHPRAQGELAQIVCDASKKRQMIVETHSEHMINRARRLVVEGKLPASHVLVHYIDRDEDGSHAVTIGIDDAGDFTRDWPDGFYDERYRETMKIAEAQARRAKVRGRKAAPR